MVAVDVIVEIRRHSRRWRVPTLTAAVVIALTVGPVALLFLGFQDSTGFERSLSPTGGLDLSDLLGPAPDSYLYTDAAVAMGARPGGGEHLFFPGLSTFALAAVGVFVLGRSIVRHAPATAMGDDVHRRPWLLLAISGATALIVSLGPEVLGIPAPFRLLFDVAPGFDSIRVAARLAMPALLLLAVVAALGLQRCAAGVASALGARVGRAGRYIAPLAGIVVIGIVAAELAAPIPRVEARPTPEIASLYRAVRTLPDGAVVELPAATESSGVAGVFAEDPRMLYSIGDWRPRFNGTSGGTPPGYFADVEMLNTFPSEVSLATLARLDIRFVVLRLGVEDPQFQFAPEVVDGLLGALPSTAAVVARLPAGVIVDLGPAPA